MERTDYTPLQWLKEAQAEAMDLSIYLEKLIELMHDRFPVMVCNDDFAAYVEQLAAQAMANGSSTDEVQGLVQGAVYSFYYLTSRA
jgi:hypothetical protein